MPLESGHRAPLWDQPAALTGTYPQVAAAAADGICSLKHLEKEDSEQTAMRLPAEAVRCMASRS